MQKKKNQTNELCGLISESSGLSIRLFSRNKKKTHPGIGQLVHRRCTIEDKVDLFRLTT